MTARPRDWYADYDVCPVCNLTQEQRWFPTDPDWPVEPCGHAIREDAEADAW